MLDAYKIFKKNPVVLLLFILVLPSFVKFPNILPSIRLMITLPILNTNTGIPHQTEDFLLFSLDLIKNSSSINHLESVKTAKIVIANPEKAPILNALLIVSMNMIKTGAKWPLVKLDAILHF